MVKRKFFRFDTLRWIGGGFKSPSPQWVKIKLLQAQMIPGATWLETGTYLGDTTRKLANRSRSVITIEPSQELFRFAKTRLRLKKNINFLMGTSEQLFEQALLEIKDQRLNIWLDGHFSGDVTFQGVADTPILSELRGIGIARDRFDQIKVFIDDVRCFYHDGVGDNDYPPLDFLIQWSRENDFKWRIEHDIFIAEYRAMPK